MVPTGQVEKVLGPHLQRIYKIHPTPPCPSSTKPDAVSLSATAHHLRVAAEKIRELPDVRQDKIAEIRERLQQGGYEPSSSEIADRMLRRAIEKMI